MHDESSPIGLRLPIQSAGIDRSPSAAVIGEGSGVEASQNWGAIGQGLLQNLPTILGGLASFF